jgi:uncharacterized protein
VLQEKLKSLTELQNVDLEIAAAKKAADVYPKQLAELEKELAAARAEVEAERNRLTDLERQKRTLEQNVTDEKDKVKKWESRLTEQRSPREYAALAREIDIAKKGNQTMAEQIVELGKTYATQREAVKGKEQAFMGRQDQLGGKMNELRKLMEGAGGQMKTLEGKRASLTHAVDKTLLSRYENVKRKRLPALVPVKAGTCMGCNMNVPPQLYNTLRTAKGTDLCPACHRIIYAAEAIEPEASK